MSNKKNQRKIIFVGSVAGSPLIDVYSDLFYDERAEFIEILPRVNNPILRAIRMIHCSERVNNIINLPFKTKWHSALDDMEWAQNVEYHIVFIGPSYSKRPMSFWYSLKKKYNVKYSVYLLSSYDSYDCKLHKRAESINEFESKIGFEHILTTQPGDAEKYGYVLCHYCCSMIDGNASDVIENDLYLINNSKGRLKQFLDVYECARQNDVKSFFRITGVKKEEQLYPNEIIYNKGISYKETVKEIKKANCLFEILGRAQTSPSMHYFEAVLYNKKLLTDNKDVVNLPFYNPEYMHYYDSPKDIDWDWVKEQVPVDYHYDGRFSPTRLIDKIYELDEEKETDI